MEEFSVLVGKTLVSCTANRGYEEILFVTDTGETYRMYHEQSCCEHVTIEDIDNDLDVLVGSPILYADESSNRNIDDDEDRSETWTFYRIGTVKGSVAIRWHGSSNGYYSERVDFIKED